MKRLLFLTLTLAMLLAFLAPDVWAAGSVAVTSVGPRVDGRATRLIITLSWTADVADASIPNTQIDAAAYGIVGWYLYSAETNPGATPPTANYDIVINDADGLDIAGGLLQDRHATLTQLVNIGNAVFGYPMIRGTVTVQWSNNAVNSATGTLILVFIAN